MVDIVLNPDPASTYGASDAYKAAWFAAYGPNARVPDPPDFKRAIYVDDQGVPRLDATTTLMDYLQPSINSAAGSVSANPAYTNMVYTNGNLTSWREDGVLHSATYDAEGNIKTHTVGSVTRTFIYDANGNLTGAS